MTAEAPPRPAHPSAGPDGRRRPSTSTWAQDLGLGLRLSTGGDRSAWSRLALVAIGIGLGVTMLLLAASVPTVLSERTARDDARVGALTSATAPDEAPLLMSTVRSTVGDRPVVGWVVQPQTADAPLPPGVDELPGPGEVVLSPALAELLASDDGAALRGRWGDDVIGTIAPEGLTGPEEYTFYLGSDSLDGHALAGPVDSFGDASRSGAGADPVFVLLGVVGLAALLVPVAIFVSTAARFGGEARDRRLAALRLVGADAATTRRIAAGETLGGALAGLALGGALYALLRGPLGALAPPTMSFYPDDFRPMTALVVLIVVVVPLTAVVVTQSALKRVVVEPLGVVRRTVARRRRLWWRLVLPVVGLALVRPLWDGLGDEAEGQAGILAGLVALLVGVALLLPWVVEASVRRLGSGGVAWDLAVRRLQLDSGTAVRAVSGIAVTVTGLVALQGLTTAVEVIFEQGAGNRSEVFDANVLVIGPDEDVTEVWPAALAGVTGVEAVDVSASYGLATEDGAGVNLRVGSCAVLAEDGELPSCADGDVFVVVGPDGTRPELGDALTTTSEDGGLDPAGATWTVPEGVATVEPTIAQTSMGGPYETIVLATPGAVDDFSAPPGSADVDVVLDESVPDAADHLRTAAAGVDPLAYVAVHDTATIAANLVIMRQVLLAGTIALLGMVGASMVVNVVEQLRERRALLAALTAFGTRRSTLGLSVLLQTAIPMTLGLTLAVVTGAGLAALLQRAVGAAVVVEWAGIGLTAGVAAVVVLGATALTLPLLWRLTKPGGLRGE